MFYLMISSRLSSSLMNMVRFALLAGGLVSHQLILCSNNDHLPFCCFFLWRDLPMRDIEDNCLLIQKGSLEDHSRISGKKTMKADPKGSQDYFQSAN